VTEPHLTCLNDTHTPHPNLNALAWSASLFACFDALSTVIGIKYHHEHEANPAMQRLIHTLGVNGAMFVRATVLGIATAALALCLAERARLRALRVGGAVLLVVANVWWCAVCIHNVVVHVST